ncbi:glutamyl-tRNA reductase [Robiginitalea sediminis]|uniref:glutamyl-tRNA reductase n=1 Tax=Robiginitalea sediminis TaxID=1982593 RepID=UPI000B4B15DF|nr:hypothetical protein [Robiginitalea sediminis]
MEYHLRYISISHGTAPVSARQAFHFPEEERDRFLGEMTRAFPDIKGLMLLVTCNRTELYAESSITPAKALLRFLLKDRTGQAEEAVSDLFQCGDETQESLRHLLRVSAGLESAVLGDAEIIHQIKKAYHRSLDSHLQGSLLERTMQTVFRFHKRISNETAFRDGTTSTAYQALKLVRQTFEGAAGEKRILVVGAGDIVKQLLKYNGKFGYRNLYLTNRTASRAEELAEAYGLHTWSWERLLQGDLDSFDVIIGAASHCPALVSGGWNTQKRVLLIDLAVPHNICLPEENRPGKAILYDLDSISRRLQENKVQRHAAIEAVGHILEEAMEDFSAWHADAPRRALLSDRKRKILNGVRSYYQNQGMAPGPETLTVATDRLLRKWRHKPEQLRSGSGLDTLIREHESLLQCS